MKPSAYLRDRWVGLLIAVLAMAFVGMVLHVFGLPDSAIILVESVLLMACVGSLAFDYLRRRRFYHELRVALADVDKRYLSSEVLVRPDFLDGRIVYDALHGASKDMNDRIAEYRHSSEEYRDYIETWVHEVKTPIAAAELVVGNMQEEETAVEQAGKVGEQLARIEGYVDQALYFARGSTLERDYLIREVDLGDLVRQALRAHSRSLIDADVRPILQELDKTVFTDPKWCVFVLGQLIENTAKYRKPEGDAHIVFTGSRRDTGTSGELVILRVEDDGIGMPQSDVPRAFDRGFTGENGRTHEHSTGIGLYLVKRLCEKMGLSVDLGSTLGQGTWVEIGFPCNRMYLP